MASCTFHRLCSSDLTTTVSHGKFASRLIYVESENKIFVAWIERAAIKFAKYDPDTHAASGEVTIHSYTANSTVGAIDMVRLASGTLVVVWYAGSEGPSTNQSCASESADGGATWTAQNLISGTNEFPVGLCDNGTNVVFCVVGLSSGGVGTGDMKAYLRTAIDTWAAVSAEFYDGDSGGANTPGHAAANQSSQMYGGLYMSSATVGVLLMWRATSGALNTRRLTAFTTTDGFATSSQVDVRSHAASAGGTMIDHVVTSAGRMWAMWPDPDSNSKPRIAYSDNVGTTWTDVGIPTAVTDQMTALGLSSLDPSYDVAITLDEVENLILFHSTGTSLSPNGTHCTYRSVTPTLTSGWVLASTCSYTNTVDVWSSIAAGRSVIVGDDLHRLTTLVRSGTHYTLEFLAVEGAGIPDEPEAPPVVATSQTDDNTQLLRLDVEEGRGWSMHTIAVSCFLSWDEGDQETGREVPILLIGNPSIDPAVQDPALVDGLTRIETGVDEGYGKRVYVDAATDQQVVRHDPLRVVIKSKVYTIDTNRNGISTRNVCRQVFVAYRFDPADDPTATVPLQVWIDGSKLNRVIALPGTGGEKAETWFSLPTGGNVGSTIQFIIDETSLYPVVVDTWGVSFIRKGRRS